MKIKIIVLVLLICVVCPQALVYASSGGSSGSFGDSDLPSWCSDLSKYNGYYRYTVNSDFDYLLKLVVGTSADSTYISTAFRFFSKDKGIDFTADNVLFFDYYYTSSSGKSSHFYYYFIPDDDTIEKEDLFYYVKVPAGSGVSYTGSVYSKSLKKNINGTFYRGQTAYDSNVDKAYVNIYYGCYGPESVPYGGDFSIESNIACYMTSNSVDDVYSGNIQPDNLEDLLPKRYGVLEVPQNIQFTGSKSYGFTTNKEHIFDDDDIKITWTQTDPNYKLWSTEILIYGNMGVKWWYELFSSYERVYDLFLYSEEFSTSKLSFTIDIEKMIYKNPIWLSKVYEILDSSSGLYDDSCFGVSLMIRNKYFDGEYTYYSNWVELYFDDEGMAGGVSNEECGSNTEYDYDDPVNGDEDVDFTQQKPIGPVNPDSPYQGGSINPSTDFSILDFLHNGFGLAGEGGVIDMFRELFSFIPAPVWTLILTGISILISIALLKAVL